MTSRAILNGWPIGAGQLLPPPVGTPATVLLSAITGRPLSSAVDRADLRSAK